MDPAVTAWKQVRNQLRALAEHQLKRRQIPASRAEIQELVLGYCQDKY
jgi:hypothetical protein